MTASSTFGYAKTEDGVYLGYRVDGDGPIDIVNQSDWPGNIDLEWEDPFTRAWFDELLSFSRVITHDPRGSAFRAATSICQRSRPACPTS